MKCDYNTIRSRRDSNFFLARDGNIRYLPLIFTTLAEAQAVLQELHNKRRINIADWETITIRLILPELGNKEPYKNES